MNTSLKNLNILVTRPQHQAQELCDEIKKLCGNPILFPTIEIADLEDSSLIESTFQKLNEFDFVIFISPNTVEKAFKFFQKNWPEKVKAIAVGISTAHALERFGVKVVSPAVHFSTEGVLDLPVLRTIINKQIAIFKGEGGREELSNTLRDRGAIVQEVSVYRRVKPLGLISLSKNIDIIICTSNTGLQNLYEMVGALDRRWLLQKPLLVISERMIALAHQLGFVKEPRVADNATDAAIIAALLKFVGE